MSDFTIYLSEYGLLHPIWSTNIVTPSPILYFLLQITVFAFGVGLVSIFGIYEDDRTHFSGFEKAFKTLFWIIFDPGEQLILFGIKFLTF